MTGGTGYDPENRDPDYSKFTEWLQCYYKDGMKNMADHNKRTMWYAGDPGPMVPSSNYHFCTINVINPQ